MLKKVSSAISKFISPIASSGRSDSGLVKDQSKPKDFRRFKVITNEDHPENQKESKQEDGETKDGADEHPEEHTSETVLHPQGLGHRFINLLSKIQSKQSAVARKKGKREYIEAEQKKQKKLKVKKGAMLNENVE